MRAGLLVGYPLRVFYDCSTMHLPRAERDYLDHWATAYKELRPGGIMCGSMPHGWFVWAATERGDIPDNLWRIIEAARRAGAEYILFDGDAPQHAAWPTFDDWD